MSRRANTWCLEGHKSFEVILYKGLLIIHFFGGYRSTFLITCCQTITYSYYSSCMVLEWNNCSSFAESPANYMVANFLVLIMPVVGWEPGLYSSDALIVNKSAPAHILLFRQSVINGVQLECTVHVDIRVGLVYISVKIVVCLVLPGARILSFKCRTGIFFSYTRSKNTFFTKKRRKQKVPPPP